MLSALNTLIASCHPLLFIMVRSVHNELRKLPLYKQLQLKRPTYSETVWTRNAAFEYKFGADVDKVFQFNGIPCSSCVFECPDLKARVDTIHCQICKVDVCKKHLFVCIPCRLVHCKHHEYFRPHCCKRYKKERHLQNRARFVRTAEALGMILTRTWKDKSTVWKRLRQSFCFSLQYNLKALDFKVMVTSARQISLNECGDHSLKSEYSHANLKKGKVS